MSFQTSLFGCTLDGNFSAKQVLEFLHSHPPPLAWAAFIWRACIPPSSTFTVWRLLHNKLSTNENLRSRGCTMVSVCVLCFDSEESSSHLFLTCPYARHIWQWLAIQLHCSLDTSYVVVFNCVPANCSSQVRDVFLAALVHTFHTIWLAQNMIRFGRGFPHLYAAKSKIASSIALSGNISKGDCTTSDNWLMENFMIAPSFQRFKDIIPVFWKPPTPPFIKVNTNGSVLGCHAACGGIFRDHRGTFLACFPSNLGISSVLEAELHGMILAMEHGLPTMGRRFGLRVFLQQLFKHSRIPTLSLSVYVTVCWHNWFQLGIQAICSHIFWEGNCCADKLATHGHSVSGTVWLSSIHQAFLGIVMDCRTFVSPSWLLQFIFIASFCLLEGFGLVLPLCIYFSFFVIIFIE